MKRLETEKLKIYTGGFISMTIEENESEEDNIECVCEIRINWTIATKKLSAWIDKELEKDGNEEIVILRTNKSEILDIIGIKPKFIKHMNMKSFGIVIQQKMSKKGYIVQSSNDNQLFTITRLKKNEDLDFLGNSNHVTNKIQLVIYKKTLEKILPIIEEGIDKSKNGEVITKMEDVRLLLGEDFDNVSDRAILKNIRIEMRKHNIFVGSNGYHQKGLNIEFLTFRYMTKEDIYNDKIDNDSDLKNRIKKRKIPTWKKNGFDSKEEYEHYKDIYGNGEKYLSCEEVEKKIEGCKKDPQSLFHNKGLVRKIEDMNVPIDEEKNSSDE